MFLRAAEHVRHTPYGGQLTAVKDPVRAIHRHPAVADRTPRDAYPRREVVVVGRPAVWGQIRHVLRHLREDLILIADACLQRQAIADAPVIVREQREIADSDFVG